MDDLAAHPQNRYVTVETPAGPVRLLAPGATVDGEVAAAGSPAEVTDRRQALTTFQNGIQILEVAK